MVGKDKPTFYASHQMTAIAVLGMPQLAENVQGIIVPNSGHFIAGAATRVRYKSARQLVW
jgi:hypothetical protein